VLRLPLLAGALQELAPVQRLTLPARAQHELQEEQELVLRLTPPWRVERRGCW